MSAGKPTPGPWAVSDDAGQAVVSLGDVPVRDIVVATLPRIHHANARLIAASPDLLAALKQMVAVVGGQSADGPDDGSIVALAVSMDAIAKAEGES